MYLRRQAAGFENMKNVISDILSALIWAVTIILLFFVLSGLYQRICGEDANTGFFGIGYAVVVSGSMEPNIHVGDLVIFQKHDTASYETGDIVVYERTNEDETILIIHRIVSVEGDTFVTRGDANQTNDVPITGDRIVGRMAVRLPYIGRLVGFVRKPAGLIVCVGVCVLLCLLGMCIRMRRRNRKTVLTLFGRERLNY